SRAILYTDIPADPMAEHEPLDIQPLSHAYPTQEGPRDLLLGQSTRVDFGYDVAAEIYASHRVMKVETPISLFEIIGVKTIEISPHAVEFHAQNTEYKAVLTFFTDGGLVTQIVPLP